MAKYFITGRQGSGKTTAIKCLRELGYTAYNTDDLPGVTRLQDKETGKIIDWPKGIVDWTQYAWNWQKSEINQLIQSDDIVFVGAIVSNQVDYYYMFDKVFVITVSSSTLISRLSTHEHDTHHMSGEIDRIAKDHETKQQLLLCQGAIPINGERSVEEVVNDILNQTGLK